MNHNKRLIEIEDLLFDNSATKRLAKERAARAEALETWRARVGQPAAVAWARSEFNRGYNDARRRRAQAGEI